MGARDNILEFLYKNETVHVQSYTVSMKCEIIIIEWADNIWGFTNQIRATADNSSSRDTNLIIIKLD